MICVCVEKYGLFHFIYVLCITIINLFQCYFSIIEILL